MSAPPRVVQRTPDLGLTIKLQRLPEAVPEPEAPAPPPPCPPARVLNPAGEVVAELGCGEEYQYECPPSGGGCECDPAKVTGAVWSTPHHGYLADWGEEILIDPPWLSFADHGAPSARHLACSLMPNPSGQVVFFGVPEGEDITGVTWEWSWSAEVLHGGDVRASGPVLVVEVKTDGAFDGSQEYQNTITAIAKCGENEVATLSLRLEAQPY